MKFNTKTHQPAPATTTNYMGGKAFLLTPEMELYTTVVTTLCDNSYYEKGEARMNRIRSLMKQVDPEFVAKLGVYVRTKMNLRSVPLVLAVELSRIHKGDSLVSRMVERVVQRADEITELLAYYQMANSRSGSKKLNKLSKQLQKGLANSFNKFDEYQFAKYNRKTAVSLKDALFLVHPKAKDEGQQAIFNRLVNEELSTPFTWEVELSRFGQEKFQTEAKKRKAKAQKWEELVRSGKMGYMALLRNLRNLVSDGTAKAFEAALETITNPERVKRSRQMPFRFLSAYAELEKLKSEVGCE